jgi:hypothetical protein
VTAIVSVDESFDRFIAAWNAGEDEYTIGLVALTEQGDALATDLRARRDNCKQGVMAALVARLAVHHGSARAIYEKLSLFGLVREAAWSPSNPNRQLSREVTIEAFSILDDIYQRADADTKAVIEDELFEFEPGFRSTGSIRVWPPRSYPQSAAIVACSRSSRRTIEGVCMTFSGVSPGMIRIMRQIVLHDTREHLVDDVLERPDAESGADAAVHD